ncbi:hypothetical protein P175DRAFT_0497936 [Aspergillus ochraceoroseus IBT 24754]|uniref:Uncharacterized protein n=1 Tax=Aspergillus ochraceoroseus IBT 24754 TaxID=1392256 RepID=A0A2T5M8H6_9EURO|nr:uncharacterized protein P175DRAFT_0497936 [Aspergillus ochraceoroseus IBT 24754]PTU24826.1 hypothetical protein P175DRAFT_0497936 [Aspergillus ochraceoroseus IBT 24754]
MSSEPLVRNFQQLSRRDGPLVGGEGLLPGQTTSERRWQAALLAILASQFTEYSDGFSVGS